MATDWQMPRRSDSCSGCQVVFEPGAGFTAYLYDSPAGFERRDFCNDCRPPAEPPPLGNWRTRRPASTARKTAAFDRDAVLGFFNRLDKADTPEQLRFRFVLALLLWRKKALKFETSETREDGEYWRFSAVSTRQRCDVFRPELDEEEIDRLSAQLEALLASAGGEEIDAGESEGDPTMRRVFGDPPSTIAETAPVPTADHGKIAPAESTNG